MFTTEAEVREYAADLLRHGATQKQVRVLLKNKIEIALLEERWSEVEPLAAVLDSPDYN